MLSEFVLPKLCARFDRIKILDIGGGTGWIDNRILQFSEEQQKEIQITILEPAENAAHDLYGRFEGFENVHILEERFEDWDKEKNECFDIVIASHVMYYFRDRKNFVERCLARVNAGGMLVIVAVSISILQNDIYQTILPAFRRQSNLPRTDVYDGDFGFAEEIEHILFSLNQVFTLKVLPSKLFLPASTVLSALSGLGSEEVVEQDLFTTFSFLWHFPPEVLAGQIELWRDFLEPLVRQHAGLNINYEDKLIFVTMEE